MDGRLEARARPAGCLVTLGVAIGTWLATCAGSLLALILIPSIYASALGRLMAVVLLLHLVGFGLARGRITGGAHLLRTAAAVVAVEVGLVVALLLFFAVL